MQEKYYLSFLLFIFSIYYFKPWILRVKPIQIIPLLLIDIFSFAAIFNLNYYCGLLRIIKS